MAVDLRQVMAAFLTFSMFAMLGNMIKRDHIDPLWEPEPETTMVQYGMLKNSKPGMHKLSEANYGPWKEHDEIVKPCSKKPLFKGKEQSNGYIFFSLTHGPEYHASQVANAVAVARYLGATLVLPDVRGAKLGDKRNFKELYDVEKFTKTLTGVVRVEKTPPKEISKERLPIIKVPYMVSEEYVASNIKPIFKNETRNLKIVTYFNNNSSPYDKIINRESDYQCLAMYESLKPQKELQELIDSMVGTLRSMSKKTNGRFVSVDLRAEMFTETSCKLLGSSGGHNKRWCYNGERIGEFLKKIGFHEDTTVYLTQTGWDTSLNALRDVFPNTFTKDAIMPADEKAKFTDAESRKTIDFYVCAQGDVFVPAYPSRFYEAVVGERIGLGKTQIFIPAEKDSNSDSATDYVSPYVANRSHFAHSCFC
ncbi:hypothetical protein ABFS82_10G068300 [Erythranthe guttata]|uniref:O-fucosyltransferase family protein n=2 Tax=Erythranthe guttata TaxID=4155 RepID=A0A022PVC5_ERYGU|nr:hypothetical protein MIMGU_mgv1a023399mg [Erythranthe guttata]